MLSAPRFIDFVKKLRSGDSSAMRSFVREYETLIQQSVRVRLRSMRLSRIIDSSDISQAVLSDFFRQKMLYRISLKNRDRLVRLLVRMAHNKVLDEARRNYADCRDHRRLDSMSSNRLAEVSFEREPSPFTEVAGNELVREICIRLSAEERRLAQLRFDGIDWSTLARDRGMKPDAVRKKLARAIERVGRELKLESITMS